MKRSLKFVIPILALATTPGYSQTSDAPQGCDGARRVCICAAPRKSESCRRVAPECAGRMTCAGKICQCPYWPGFLGGPMRRD